MKEYRQMTLREYGEITTQETRSEANEKVDRQKRYTQIIECLQEYGTLTAKECAVKLYKKGLIPSSERNFTAPRLTELCEKGVVEPAGKKLCEYTGRKVACYVLREGGKNET